MNVNKGDFSSSVSPRFSEQERKKICYQIKKKGNYFLYNFFYYSAAAIGIIILLPILLLVAYGVLFYIIRMFVDWDALSDTIKAYLFVPAGIIALLFYVYIFKNIEDPNKVYKEYKNIIQHGIEATGKIMDVYSLDKDVVSVTYSFRIEEDGKKNYYIGTQSSSDVITPRTLRRNRKFSVFYLPSDPKRSFMYYNNLLK